METTKKCRGCEKDLPLDEFYKNQAGKHGRATYCKACDNARKRDATPKKVNRTRARHRAVKDLIAAHPDEFARYLATRLAEAETEAETLTEAAANLPSDHDHEPSAKPQPVRLRSGPRKNGETVIERIDVARCGECRTHHDRGHRCPACGTSPRHRPVVVSADQIRANIRASGGER